MWLMHRSLKSSQNIEGYIGKTDNTAAKFHAFQLQVLVVWWYKHR